jgi:hypothetical protein
MKPSAYAIVIVLVIVVIAVVIYWSRQKGKCSPACVPPATCQDGICTTPAPTACTPAQLAKLAVTPYGGVTPGHCVPSADGRWLTFGSAYWSAPPNAGVTDWTVTPNVTDAACQVLCANDPTCYAWTNGGKYSQMCAGYTDVPTGIMGNKPTNMGISTRAFAV